jgi:hypothetical protein
VWQSISDNKIAVSPSSSRSRIFPGGGIGSFHGSGLGRRGGCLTVDDGVGEDMSEIIPGHASGCLSFCQRQDLTKATLDIISASTSGVSMRRHRLSGMPGAGSLEGLNPIVAQGIAICDPMKMMDLQRGARALLGAIEMDPRAFVRRLRRVYGVGNIRVVQALARHYREVLGIWMSDGAPMDEMVNEGIGANMGELGDMSPYSHFSRGNTGGRAHPRSRNPFRRFGGLFFPGQDCALMDGAFPFGRLEGNSSGGWQGGPSHRRPGEFGAYEDM